MTNNSHQSDDENTPAESDSSGVSRFLSWEEVQKRVEEKFAKYGLTREEVDLIDEALENGETPDVSAEKLQAHYDMNEDSDQELRDSIDGLLESIRPKYNLPTWQVDNVVAAWSGDLSNTLGQAFAKSLPKFFAQPAILGPSLLQGYLKDTGFFKNVFSDGFMPWRPEFSAPSVSVFSGFDFTQLSAFVSAPGVEEELDELIEANDEVRDFAEDSASEVAESAGVSRPVAMRLSVAAVYVIHWGLVLFIMTGLPMNDLVPLIIATLSARGDAKDVIARFKKENED